MWKIRNRLNQLQQRKEILKYTKNKRENQESNIVSTKTTKLYDYYKCDYCRDEIRLNKKQSERTGGIVTFPHTLTKRRKINTCSLQQMLKQSHKRIYGRGEKRKMKNMEIENYLSTTKYITRKELTEKTGLSDREVRRKISELKKHRVVLYNSSRSGYRLAKEFKSMSNQEREEEIRLVEHSLNECKSRTKQLRKQMRKYIAYIKKAEQIKLEEENYNHIPRID